MLLETTQEAIPFESTSYKLTPKTEGAPGQVCSRSMPWRSRSESCRLISKWCSDSVPGTRNAATLKIHRLLGASLASRNRQEGMSQKETDGVGQLGQNSSPNESLAAPMAGSVPCPLLTRICQDSNCPYKKRGAKAANSGGPLGFRGSSSERPTPSADRNRPVR